MVRFVVGAPQSKVEREFLKAVKYLILFVFV